MAYAEIAKDNEYKYEIIDKQGNIVIELNKEDIVTYPYKFSDGLLLILRNGKVGYINREGKAIIGNIEE